MEGVGLTFSLCRAKGSTYADPAGLAVEDMCVPLLAVSVLAANPNPVLDDEEEEDR